MIPSTRGRQRAVRYTRTAGGPAIFPRGRRVTLTAVTVTICDVGPRDGLQNEPGVLAPPVRAELVDRLADAGLPAIEAVSFVHPDRVPQMAGAEEVVAAFERREGVVYSGLVLNERGYERLQ